MYLDFISWSGYKNSNEGCHLSNICCPPVHNYEFDGQVVHFL